MAKGKKVRDCMTTDVRVIGPGTTLRDAARAMAEIDAGSLPVGENDRLVGLVTDRDITIRGIAEGKGPDTPVSEVMSSEVKYVFDDQDVDEVSRNMAAIQVRRLPVVNRDKRLVGIISLGDLARSNQEPEQVGEALEGISRPGGQHNQTSARH